MNTYQSGDDIVLTTTFTDAGTIYQPDTVELLIKAPLTNLQTLAFGTDTALLIDTDFIFSIALDLDAVGHWEYVWVSDDSNSGHVEQSGEFQVIPSASMLIKDLK